MTTVKHNLKAVLSRLELETGSRPSYRELADMIGCSVTTISDMANNNNGSVRLSILGQLCEILNVEPGELLVRVDTQPQPKITI